MICSRCGAAYADTEQECPDCQGEPLSVDLLAERVERNERLAKQAVRTLAQQIKELGDEETTRFDQVWDQMKVLNDWAKKMLKQIFRRVEILEKAAKRKRAAGEVPEATLAAIGDLQKSTLALGAELDSLRTELIKSGGAVAEAVEAATPDEADAPAAVDEPEEVDEDEDALDEVELDDDELDDVEVLPDIDGAVFSALQERIAALQERLEEVEQVHGLGAMGEDDGARGAVLAAQVERTEAAIATLEEQGDALLAFEERITALEARDGVADDEADLESLEERLAALEARDGGAGEADAGDLSGLEERVAALEARDGGAGEADAGDLSGLEERLAALEARDGRSDTGDLTGLAERVAALEARDGAGEADAGDLSSLQKRVSRLEDAADGAGPGRLGALEGRLEALERTVDSSAGKLPEAAQQLIDALAAELETASSALATLEASAETHSTSDAQLAARISGIEDALPGKLDRLREDLEARASATHDALERIGAEARAELAEARSAFDAKLATLAVEGELAGLTQRAEALEDAVAAQGGLRARIAELEAVHEAQAGLVEARLLKLEADLTELAELRGRLEKSGAAGAQPPLEELESALLEKVDTQLAARVQLSTVDLKRRLEQLEKAGAGNSGSQSAVMGTTRHMAALGYDSKFITLVREVKALRERVNGFLEAPEELFEHPDFSAALAEHVASGGLQDSEEVPGLREILNSPAFKEMFDQKIQQVLEYIRDTVVPKAVKQARKKKKKTIRESGDPRSSSSSSA